MVRDAPSDRPRGGGSRFSHLPRGEGPAAAGPGKTPPAPKTARLTPRDALALSPHENHRDPRAGDGSPPDSGGDPEGGRRHRPTQRVPRSPGRPPPPNPGGPR